MVAPIRDPRDFKITSVSQIDFNKDGDIASFVMGRWQKRDQHRARLEAQWYNNLGQFRGYQYHTYDPSTGNLNLPDAPPWRVRLVANRLMMVALKVVSKAMSQHPKWVVIPATGDHTDRNVSIVSEKILSYYWRWLNMDSILVQAFTWCATTGNVFLRVYWDPDKGPELDIADQLQNLPPEMAETLGEGRTVNLGDVVVEVASPLEIDVDPEATTLDDASHIIHTKLRNKDYIEERYGVKNIEPDANDDQSMTRYYMKRIQSWSGQSGQFAEKNEDEEKNSVLTHTLWVNPTKKYPKGWYAIVANNKVLHKSPELPNPWQKIPYVHFVEKLIPGNFWGTCALELCIPLQSEYNRSRSQLIENANLMARPKWLLPKGSGVSGNQLTSQPGEVVEYTPGMKPEAWTPPPIPEYALRRPEWALRDIEDCASIHEVTQGRSATTVRSGVQVAELQEQDDQMLSPFYLLASKEIAKIGAWVLQLLATHVKEDRIIKIVGDDRQIESKEFTGQSIYGPNVSKPGVNYFDVECQMGSQLPLSKSRRIQMGIDLVTARILDPVADKKKIFKILELGTEDPALTEDQLDTQLAQHENINLSQGMYVQINPWDSDEVHYNTLRLYQKQPEYQELRKIDPQIDERFENHASQHLFRLRQAMGPAQGPPANTQQPTASSVGEAQPPSPAEAGGP